MNLEISLEVQNRLWDALTDATTGFNAQLLALAPVYGITPFTINFGNTSDGPDPPTNFMFGRIAPAVANEMSAVPDISSQDSTLQKVFMTIDTISEEDSADERYRIVSSATYAGPVEGIIETTLIYAPIMVPNLTRFPNAIGKALRLALSSPDVQHYFYGVQYNPKWRYVKHPIQFPNEQYFYQVTQALPKVGVIIP